MNPEYPVSEAAERIAANDAPIPYVSARRLSKTFGHVRALRNVDVDIHESEVLAIVGDNGAGKSTLTKILSGVLQPDRGEILVRGRRVRMTNPRVAHQFGIATVFQNLTLVNCRDVACNLFLGREPTRWGIFVNRGKMLAQTRAALAELDITIAGVCVRCCNRQCQLPPMANNQGMPSGIVSDPVVLCRRQ